MIVISPRRLAVYGVIATVLFLCGYNVGRAHVPDPAPSSTEVKARAIMECVRYSAGRISYPDANVLMTITEKCRQTFQWPADQVP